MESSGRRYAVSKGGGWRKLAGVGLGLLLTGLAAGEAVGQRADTRAPFDLVGTVVDGDGRPLVGAFVALEGSDRGSLTGEEGRFVIPGVTPGTVSLTAELLGYQTLTWTVTVAEGEPLELTLPAQPIVLEGLKVVTDRFERRRRATAASVHSFDRSALATSPDDNVIDFVVGRSGLARVPCRGEWSDECFLVRGRAVEPSVWIDEAPMIGGMDYLRTVRPHELYMVEVFARGRHIRAYTHLFMEQAAKTRLQPIAFVF